MGVTPAELEEILQHGLTAEGNAYGRLLIGEDARTALMLGIPSESTFEKKCVNELLFVVLKIRRDLTTLRPDSYDHRFLMTQQVTRDAIDGLYLYRPHEADPGSRFMPLKKDGQLVP